MWINSGFASRLQFIVKCAVEIFSALRQSIYKWIDTDILGIVRDMSIVNVREKTFANLLIQLSPWQYNNVSHGIYSVI